LDNAKKLIEGIGGMFAVLAGIVGQAVGLQKNIKEWIVRTSDWPDWTFWLIYASCITLGFSLLIKWRSRHSRLVHPEALRLDRDNVDHLIGREDDVAALLPFIYTNPITIIEGESGCGKSALLRSGLLPKLVQDSSILPLLIVSWGNDWQRGPTLALHRALSSAIIQRADLTLPSAAAQTKDHLTASDTLRQLVLLETTLTTLANSYRLMPILIFDQFDDYQALHREQFLLNKIWLTPTQLRRENHFWELIGQLTHADTIRCLFITRSDTAAGLTSVAFQNPISVYRLDRIPSQFIGPLLEHLSNPHSGELVVTDPDRGWNRLRERLVRDLSQDGVILPQQLKIALASLQALRYLNISEYEKAGAALGMEAMFVERQITATARKAGVPIDAVRRMLVALIDPENPTKSRSLSSLRLLEAGTITPHPIATTTLTKAIEELERAELLRRLTIAEAQEPLWQLDHDYLTRGVGAAERRASRWRYLLTDGALALANAQGRFLASWRALLPIRDQIALFFAWVRGMHNYEGGASYAFFSLAKFLPILVCAVAVGISAWQYLQWSELRAAQTQADLIWKKLEFLRGSADFYEFQGLWQLASTSSDLVRHSFLDTFVSSPEDARKLRRHPAPIIHSLVGVNPDVRRTTAEAVAKVISAETTDIDILIASLTTLRELNAANQLPVTELLKTMKRIERYNGSRNLFEKDDDATKIIEEVAVLAALGSAEDVAQQALAQVLADISVSEDPGQLASIGTALASRVSPSNTLALLSSVLSPANTSATRKQRAAFIYISEALANRCSPSELGKAVDLALKSGGADAAVGLPVVASIAPRLLRGDAIALFDNITDRIRSGDNSADSMSLLMQVADTLRPKATQAQGIRAAEIYVQSLRQLQTHDQKSLAQQMFNSVPPDTVRRAIDGFFPEFLQALAAASSSDDLSKFIQHTILLSPYLTED
jgi:hypothetical protein